MPKCIMLVGLPGVGKSTWLTNNTDLFEQSPAPRIVSSDFYIEECARILGAMYYQIFPHIIGFAERAFENDIDTLAFNGYDLIIDRTNLHKKARREIMGRIMKNAKEPYQFEAIVFKTPDERTHMDRLASSFGKYIPKDTMNNMKRIYTPPTNDEGFTNIRFLEI